jgi:hypothetical protein
MINFVYSAYVYVPQHLILKFSIQTYQVPVSLWFVLMCRKVGHVRTHHRKDWPLSFSI